MATESFADYLARKAAEGEALGLVGGVPDGIDVATEADLDAHEADTANPHEVTKAQVGLGNVDNTADADKPISTATQNALDGKVDVSGQTGTVNLTTATAVQVPAISGANQAARVTAWDPATGQLQIDGFECGYTPSITPTLLNGWTATYIVYRREGRFVVVEFRGLNGAAASSNTWVSLPPGFRPATTAPQFFTNGNAVSSAHLVAQCPTNGSFTADRSAVTDGHGAFVIPTVEPWATSI